MSNNIGVFCVGRTPGALRDAGKNVPEALLTILVFNREGREKVLPFPVPRLQVQGGAYFPPVGPVYLRAGKQKPVL